MTGQSLCLILNGKKSGLFGIREAVDRVRRLGHSVEVRVTWESGDGTRYAAEALRDNVDIIVAGGGDGTVNEVVNGIFSATQSPQVAMAVLPLGSANDFARGCNIPVGDIEEALRFAATGESTVVDVGRINKRYFLNAVIAGFGAEVTFRTSDRMKKTISGAAYALTGLLMALKPTIYSSRVKTDAGEREDRMVFAAVANCVQAGGLRVAPRARLNDGLIDVVFVPDFPITQLPRVFQDFDDLESLDPQLLRYEQIEWMEIEADQEIPASPDGQELTAKHIQLDMLKRCLPFVLPEDAPVVR